MAVQLVVLPGPWTNVTGQDSFVVTVLVGVVLAGLVSVTVVTVPVELETIVVVRVLVTTAPAVILLRTTDELVFRLVMAARAAVPLLRVTSKGSLVKELLRVTSRLLSRLDTDWLWLPVSEDTLRVSSCSVEVLMLALETPKGVADSALPPVQVLLVPTPATVQRLQSTSVPSTRPLVQV